MKTMTIFPHKTAKLLSELKLAYTFINSLMFDLIEGNWILIATYSSNLLDNRYVTEKWKTILKSFLDYYGYSYLILH